MADAPDKVQFRAVSKAHPDQAVVFDYKEPLGDNQGITGLEGLLLSLGACSATGVAYVLRRMHRTV